MRRGVLLTLLASMAVTAGCNVLDEGTLAQLDVAGGPLNADPAKMEILVELPPGLGIPLGAAVMNVSAVRNDIGARNDASYVLEQGERGDGLRRFRVAPADLDRLRAQQSLLRDWEGEAPDRTDGSLTVDVQGCAVGAGPSPTASVSIFAVILPNPTPRPLIRGVPVSQIMDATDQRELPPC